MKEVMQCQILKGKAWMQQENGWLCRKIVPLEGDSQFVKIKKS
jgi:hypothetical protein